MRVFHFRVFMFRDNSYFANFFFSIKLLVAAANKEKYSNSMVKFLVPTFSVSIIMTRGRVAAMFSRQQIRVCPSVCFLNRGKQLSVKKALLQIKKRPTLASLYKGRSLNISR
jgi:hypothetical protein